MGEFDFSNIDLSAFVRPLYQSKTMEELLSDANSNGCAAYEIAQRYARSQNKDDALKYYRIAEQLGDNGAILEIALLLHEKKKYKEAADYFKKAIELTGDMDAYVYLAGYYIDGKIGLINREKKAHNLLLTAAKKGYAKAQYMVALSYLEGIGTYKDMREYVFWMRCAQRNGFSAAEDHIKVRMSDKSYTRAWESMIKEADKRLSLHDEYLAFERLVKEIQQSEL